MPLTPDIVAEFVVGDTCPPSDVLERLSEQLGRAFLPSLSGERKSLAVCTRRLSVGTNVVSVGIWAETTDFTDTQLREALAETDLVVPGRPVALLVTTRAIQLLAAAAWASTDKKIGRVTLDDEINVQVGTNGIVTEVSGTFDPPLLIFPDVGFTATIQDRLSLGAPGSKPPLQTDSSTDLDVGTPGVLAASLIIGLLSPILGAIVFFATEPVAESQAPDRQGVGGQLAAQWPSEILTPIVPGFLPGKFELTWNDLTVDERGVITRGSFAPATRAPRVTILGPRSVVIREALGHAQARYGVQTRDLRSPLAVRWSGAATGTGTSTRVLFHSAGQKELTVAVSDTDGLSAAAEVDVSVSITPLEDGQQPF